LVRAGGMGLSGTFTREGGWGRRRQPIDPVENLEPREQEHLMV